MADQGFFGNLAGSMQSPLFLGGAGLLMGGGFQGMNSGIHQGVLGQKQQADEAYRIGELQRQQQMDAEKIRQFNIHDQRAEALHPLDILSRQAQINMQNAHAKYYSQAGDAKLGVAGHSPLDNMGLDRDGNFVPLRTSAPQLDQPQPRPPAPWELQTPEQMGQGGILGQQRAAAAAPSVPGAQPVAMPGTMTDGMGFAAPPTALNPAVGRFASSAMLGPQPETASAVLGDSASQPSTSTSRSMPGQLGRTNTSVPGIVVDAKGKTDLYASRQLAGQDALDERPEDMRARLQKHVQNQQFWTYAHGKPAPSGMAYNDDGSLRDLKDESKKNAAAMKAAPMISDIEVAKKVLVDGDSTMLGRASAMTPWLRRFTPEYTGAIENLKHTVATMTALVEGNRHANAQDVRFLKFFSVEPDDTQDSIGRKLDQLSRIYKTYVGDTEGAKAGSLYKSESMKAAERINGGPLPGYQPKQKGALESQQPQGMKSGNYRFDPATGTMVPQ